MESMWPLVVKIAIGGLRIAFVGLLIGLALGSIQFLVVRLRRRRAWQRSALKLADQPITSEQIDVLLRFLETFEGPSFQGGNWHKPQQEPSGVQLPFFQLSFPVDQFEQALFMHGWIRPFNLPGWQETKDQFVKSPDRLASADAETIRKLFTIHVYRNRLCEGHLAAMFENGHIVALLRRLKEIRQAMPNDAGIPAPPQMLIWLRAIRGLP